MKLIEGSQHYWIDDDGQIWRDKTKLIKPWMHTSKKALANGALPRLGVDLDIGRRIYHRVIAENLVPGWFADAVVDHIDRDSLNNHPSNLRWVTRSRNRLNCDEKSRTAKIKATWRTKNACS